jgi:mono/diheme cytochrome c family protein
MTEKNLSWLASAGIALALALSAAGAQVVTDVGNPQAGRAFALRNCTDCHLVSPRQSTPPRVAKVPSFQAISRMRSTTEMSLRAFFATPHPNMPNFVLGPNDQADVIAYILSLRGRP